ncbi:hypothetical protein RhiJN_11964 [Ceratobasidium sp. AG-Ba]|nr:hypothetical protein RhiJN_11964 [Ceratobasidium sp. AG-Ba]
MEPPILWHRRGENSSVTTTFVKIRLVANSTGSNPTDPFPLRPKSAPPQTATNHVASSTVTRNPPPLISRPKLKNVPNIHALFQGGGPPATSATSAVTPASVSPTPQQLPRLGHPQGPIQPRWNQQPYPYSQPLDPYAAYQYWQQQQNYPQNPHPPHLHTPSHMYNLSIPFSPVVVSPPPHTPLTSPISPTPPHPPVFARPSPPALTHAPTPSTSSVPISTTIPLNPWGSTPSKRQPRNAMNGWPRRRKRRKRLRDRESVD